jgi:uncharacterized protein (TIGR02147 family)
MAVFANSVGQSKMSIKYVIDKKRHLSKKSIQNYCPALSLHGKKKDYFLLMFEFNKAETNEEKNHYFQELLKLKDCKLKEMYLELSDLGYFVKWYYPVISELSYLKKFRPDPHWIKEALLFPVSIKEIEQALGYLKENNLLKGLHPSDKQIKVPDELRSFIYRNYVLETIELEKQAIVNIPIESRESFNLTISVSEAKFELAKTMIKNFRQELHKTLAGDDECDKVMQVNMHLFELASKREIQ